jgi:argininosuccinate lyase
VFAVHTHTQRAQPTTVAHYLLAVVEQLERDMVRLKGAYDRTNRNPLGSCAITGTGFNIDRELTSDLLGFCAPTGNTYGSIATVDYLLESTSAASVLLTGVGRFVQDLLLWSTSEFDYVRLGDGFVQSSSIMPQKRNPVALYALRMKASDVVGAAQAFVIMAHNVESGMPDYKRNQAEPPGRTLTEAAEAARRWTRVLEGLVIDRTRAADEVAADYATTTELADTLQREADVPFRLGHHFASELVSYGRSHDLRPADLPFSEVQRIYAEAAAGSGLKPDLPLDEPRFRAALSARGMIDAAKGLGGPQPAEVQRMLSTARVRLDADRAWVGGRRAALATARKRRDDAFAALTREP